MIEILKVLLLFFVGTSAGFINVMAGGGSSITLPVLIFLGLDASVANGTNRIALFVQNLSAVTSFKNENHSNFKKSLKMAVFTLPGALIGAFYAVKISNELFQKILAVIIILIAITMFFPKKKAAEGKKDTWLIYPAMFGIGFYGGFIQVGVGFLLMAALTHLVNSDLVRVNMHKVFIVLLYTIPALLVFITTKNVHWIYGIILAAGNATGAWWSAKLNVKKGDKFVKNILIVILLFMAIKLFIH